MTIGSSKNPHAASLTGGAGDETADILSLTGKISGISIYGDLIGGAGAQSAEVYAAGTLGNVKITGNLMGMNGSDSAVIFSTLKLAGVSVGGSVIGGTGDNTGVIQSNNVISMIAITGSLEGGSGDQSGVLLTTTSLSKVTIGGNISGSGGASSGVVAGASMERSAPWPSRDADLRGQRRWRDSGRHAGENHHRRGCLRMLHRLDHRRDFQRGNQWLAAGECQCLEPRVH